MQRQLASVFLFAALAAAQSGDDASALLQSGLHVSPSKADAASMVSAVVGITKFERIIDASLQAAKQRNTLALLNLGAEVSDPPLPGLPSLPGLQSLSGLPALTPQGYVAEAGTGCSLDDHKHMNTTLKQWTELMFSNNSQLLHTLPQDCGKAIGLAVNFTAFGGCIQQFFEVSPACSTCHVNLLKGLVGSNIFHLGCIPKCVRTSTACKEVTADGPSSECLEAAGNCLQCTTPAWKEHTRCVGGIERREQGLQVLDDFAAALKSGEIVRPEVFQAFLSKAAAMMQ